MQRRCSSKIFMSVYKLLFFLFRLHLHHCLEGNDFVNLIFSLLFVFKIFFFPWVLIVFNVDYE